MKTKQLNRAELKSNTLVRHFKGGLYRIVGIAKDTESGEELVIYHHNDDVLKFLYARPLGMFLSEVDKAKYPDITQKYRFELVIS